MWVREGDVFGDTLHLPLDSYLFELMPDPGNLR